MSDMTIDGLNVVLQNLRLQDGAMAKVQADYVENAIKEIERLNAKVDEMHRWGRERCELNTR